MTTQQPPRNIRESIEPFVKSGVLIIGVIYGLGILITNLHLSRFGVTEHSSFRMTYVLTGFSFLVFVLSPIVVIIPIYIGISQQNWPVLFFGTPAVFMIATGILSTVFRGTTYTVDFSAWTTYRLRSFGIYFLVYGSAIILWWAYGRRGPAFRSHFILAVALFALGIVAMIIVYVHCQHPRANPALGGGRPRLVNIQIEKGDRFAVVALGFVPDDQGFIRGESLIHEARDFYLLKPSKAKGKSATAVRLPKSFAQGLVHLQDSRDSEPKVASGNSNSLPSLSQERTAQPSAPRAEINPGGCGTGCGTSINK